MSLRICLSIRQDLYKQLELEATNKNMPVSMLVKKILIEKREYIEKYNDGLKNTGSVRRFVVVISDDELQQLEKFIKLKNRSRIVNNILKERYEYVH